MSTIRLAAQEVDQSNLTALEFLSMSRNEQQELLNCLTPQEQEELDQLLTATNEWLPLPGPQTAGYDSEAQILGYGGAAGGGKTDLLLGLASTKHYRSIIFRREYAQLEAIKDRAVLMDINFRGVPGRAFYDGRLIELGACQLPGAERKFQGRPHDFKGFDELTHFLLSQFTYLRGWLRSIRSGVPWQIAAAFNPPNDPAGRWVITFFAPWLDKKYPKPALPGELRYFIVDQMRDIEVDGPGRHTYKGKTWTAMSRTFIPSRVRDNMYLDDGQYEGVLQSLPEPLRSQLLDGDFQAGVVDNAWQLIPTVWVEQAMKRWRTCKIPDIPMEACGVDVSRGGKDRMVISPRRGWYFPAQIAWEGKVITDGPRAAQAVLAVVQPNTRINVDAIGVGTSCFDFLVGAHKYVNPFIGSEGSVKTFKNGFLRCSNLRAEGYWTLRELFDPDNCFDPAIPDDPELLSELCAITWRLTPQGIRIISKDDMIKDLGFSPDKADSLMYSVCEPSFTGAGALEYYRQLADAKKSSKE